LILSDGLERVEAVVGLRRIEVGAARSIDDLRAEVLPVHPELQRNDAGAVGDCVDTHLTADRLILRGGEDGNDWLHSAGHHRDRGRYGKAEQQPTDDPEHSPQQTNFRESHDLTLPRPELGAFCTAQ